MSPVPTIYILSGGSGASGEQVVHTVLAQYPEDSVLVKTLGHLRQPEQIADALRQARETDGLIVHTLVDSSLHAYLLAEAQAQQVPAVDLMGPLTEWISARLGKAPLEQPGLYRQLHREYFDRVAAIDYSMAHDDGKHPEGWAQAEAVLVGVSRVGKTPLSLYLAVLGWKIANYPIVPNVPVPEALFELDPRRVFGLSIEPGQLLQYRQKRQMLLGTSGYSAYVDPQSVYEELQEAKKLFRQAGFTVINMTDKTIELGADEIIRHLSRVTV